MTHHISCFPGSDSKNQEIFRCQKPGLLQKAKSMSKKREPIGLQRLKYANHILATPTNLKVT